MAMIYVVLAIIHVLACLFLIAVILLQAGRGGGLAESFNLSESIFGTKTSSFLQKATTACAIIFIFTCLGLAFLTAQRSKSLLGKKGVLENMIPLAPEPESQPLESPDTTPTTPQPEEASENQPTQEPVSLPAQ